MKIFILAMGTVAAILAICSSITSAAGVPTLQPQELRNMIQNRADIVIVDAQVKGAYDVGHIPGAINFPWEENLKSTGNLTRTKPVVIYCACGQDEKSTEMANQLMSKFGYRNVKVLKGGWLKWVELGYPQEKTAKKK
jgi:3-mercaptopyruvate sulfurtransferase SseA